jgi:peptidoglycan/LPS O-acetylase OafA/YrhL
MSSSRRHAPSTGGIRIPSLDGLRALSIAMVLFAHMSGTRFFPSFVLARRNLGNFGVRVFFVISGFLITSLLLNELKTRGRIDLKWFYIRRALRIFPAAYVYIAAMFAATLLGLVALTQADFLHAITYTVNYQKVRPWHTIHLWSLSVEEQFYMIWPAVLVLAGRRKALWIAGAVLVVAPALRVATFYGIPSLQWSVGTSFQTNADALAAGCVLAGIRGWLGNRAFYDRLLHSPAFLAIPLAVGVCCAFQQYDAFALPLGYTIMNIGVAITIDRCVRFESDAIGRILNWRPLAAIGVWSYSIYLWQEPFLNRLSTSPATWFPVNILLVFACALSSYYLVEKPFLNFRRRIETKWLPAPQTANLPPSAKRAEAGRAF